MEDFCVAFRTLRALTPDASWQQNLRATLERLVGDKRRVTPPAVISLTIMGKVEQWHLGN